VHYSADVLIVGSGVAGLSAAIYASRYELKTIVVGKMFGGATLTAWTIENYPGVKKIDGYDLVTIMKDQATALGAVIIDDEITTITQHEHCIYASSPRDTFEGHALILASGSTHRHLGLPNEPELAGKGVHYCVMCDAPLYKGKTIAIVGGGDSSVKGAVLAAPLMEHVYLITIEPSLHGEPINVDAMKKHHNITVIPNSEITALQGHDKLSGIMLKDHSGHISEKTVDAVFVEIGADPSTELAKHMGVELDEKGYINVNAMCETNKPGVLAAGDATNLFGSFKQDITAAAQGALAATSAYKYLSLHDDQYFCRHHAKSTRKSHQR